MRSFWALMWVTAMGTAGCRSGDDKPVDTGPVGDTQEDTQTETGTDTDTGEDTDTSIIDTGVPIDGDGDGFVASLDCDDANDAVYPGADELCDGVDNDCDGVLDEPDATDAPTWYADADGDGFGTEVTETACSQPHGYSAIGGDCDDANPSFHPGASESDCSDPHDYNCDGSVGYADADADGFAACVDCDDNNGSVNEATAETCDGVDNDCDGTVDEEASDATTWYADADGDGHGGTQFTTAACAAPAGYVASADDCDDLDASSYPGGTEVCDSADNNCDTQVDEGVLLTWYADADQDGYGDAASSTQACNPPPGHSSNGDDCDDASAHNHPGAWEVCDGADNDCDASIDEDDAVNASTWYADTDSDGYGNAANTTTACSQPSGHTASAGDCDDTQATVSPSAVERCDSVDNDCDGVTDEDDALDATTWFADTDADTYGDANNSAISCDQPTGYVSDATDCNDGASAASPAGTEVCGDGLDNDCNGDVDDADATDASTWYADTDADTYGDANNSTLACTQPTGYVSDATDCNDNDAAVVPDANGDCYLGSCLDLLNAGRSTGDGLYTIDPSGSSAYEVYCDMTTDGGGWTMVANISDDGSDVWSQFMPAQDAGLWDDSTTLGTAVSFTTDYKSQAYMDVPSTDLLIQEAQANVLYAGSCWSSQSFQAFISGLSWNGDGSDSNWSDSSGAHLCSFEHFSYSDSVLRAGSHSGSEKVVAFKWGERDGVQNGNKDRTMITTYKANGYSVNHHIDLPTGLGGFTAYNSAEHYEDSNECQADGPNQCTNGSQDYQLLVR